VAVLELLVKVMLVAIALREVQDMAAVAAVLLVLAAITVLVARQVHIHRGQVLQAQV
jgi:hypothetical protein